MDIKLPVDVNSTLLLNKLAPATPALKLQQILDVKVVASNLVTNQMTLEMANHTFTVQSPGPVKLPAGQALTLQVVSLIPNIEFKLISPALTDGPSVTQLPSNTPISPNPSVVTQAKPLVLTLLPVKTTQIADQSMSSNVGKADTPTMSLPKLIDAAKLPLINGERVLAQLVAADKASLVLRLFPVDRSSLASPMQQISQTAPNFPLVTIRPSQLLGFNPPPIVIKNSQPNNLPTIALEVIKTGDTVQFKQLDIDTDALPSKSDSAQINHALKQLLPIHGPTTETIEHLQQSLAKLLVIPNIEETLKHLASRILETLPRQPQLLQAPQLRQLIDDSGLFLEKKMLEKWLGDTPVQFEQDFKLKLLKLLHVIQLQTSNPNEKLVDNDLQLLKLLSDKVQQSLAKITLDQINSLPKQDTPTQVWLLDLPFLHHDVAHSVRLQIERDNRAKSGSEQKNWSVSITLTPPGLATIHCKVTGYDDTINTRFYSEDSNTVTLIDQNLQHLKQQLEDNGLKAGLMDAQQGKPAQSSIPPLVSDNLFSEKA